MRMDYLLLPAFAALVFACGGERGTEATVEIIDAPDAPAEAAWTPLFNGRDFAGWHAYGGAPVGEAWKVTDDGSFYLDNSRKDGWQVVGGGDIVTDESYANYELELEWRIDSCGNSGIIYNVVEAPEYDYAWMTGPEMQVLDNSCHPDAKIDKHKAGDLYDLVAGDSTAVRPAGQWNQARLVVTDGRVEHWLNGVKMVEYVNTGEAWADRVAASKFREWDSFGQSTSGRIALQDHGDRVWYRNVRIRPLES